MHINEISEGPNGEEVYGKETEKLKIRAQRQDLKQLNIVFVDIDYAPLGDYL